MRSVISVSYTHLDVYKRQEEVMRLMQKVVKEQKKTLVMVTHDNHLAEYADRVFHIIDGEIVKIVDNREQGKEESEESGKERKQ